MRPIIKFRYGKARCPLCLADHGSRKQYKSIEEIRSHLNLDHSYGSTYFYIVSSTPTLKGNYPFTVHGSCGCGCGESIRFPTLTAAVPFMQGHGPPYYLSGHKTRTGSNSGMFKKGHVPWTKGLKGKGICKPNSGSFKKGSIPPQDRGGLYTAPNGQNLVWTGEYQPCGTRKYRARSRLIMEGILGRPLQANEVVIHLDDISSNDDPGNLKVISRGENATRNRWRNHKPRTTHRKKVSVIRKPKIQKDLEEDLIPEVEQVWREVGPGFCSKCNTMMLPGAPCVKC